MTLDGLPLDKYCKQHEYHPVEQGKQCPFCYHKSNMDIQEFIDNLGATIENPQKT